MIRPDTAVAVSTAVALAAGMAACHGACLHMWQRHPAAHQARRPRALASRGAHHIGCPPAAQLRRQHASVCDDAPALSLISPAQQAAAMQRVVAPLKPEP